MNLLRHAALAALMCISLVPAKADGTLDSLLSTADSQHAAGHSDSAIVSASAALERAKKLKHRSAMIEAYSSLGVYLRSQGKVKEALARYDEALKLAVTPTNGQQKDDERYLEAVAVLYVNLATLHIDLQHKEEALRHARHSAEWAARCKDEAFLSQIYPTLGSILLMVQAYDEASRYLEESYQLAIRQNQPDAALTATAYLMVTAQRSGQKGRIPTLKARAERLLPEAQSFMAKLAYYQVVCAEQLSEKQYREALATSRTILGMDGIENLPFVLFDIYNNMHDACAALGDYKEAYRLLKKASALRDSLFEKEKAESLRELSVKYETKEKELALSESEALRKAELSRHRLRMGISASALLLASLLFAFFLQRQRTRTERERRRAEEKEHEYALLRHETEKRLTARYLEGLEAERKRLAKELHDGICNDLLAIEMQMNLAEARPEAALPQSGQTGAGKPVLQLLEESRQSIRRISHELQPPQFQEASLNEVMADYLSRLDEASQASIDYESENPGGDWSSLPPHIALETYRIAQEAVANALKHAQASRIAVRLAIGEGRLRLSVTDNGTCATPGSRRGIGRQTMRERADSAGGTLEENRTATGTTLQFTVPIP